MKGFHILILVILCCSFAQAEQANLKYFVFTPQCYNQLIGKGNIFHFDCIKFTFSKCLGYGIMIGGAMVKVPQLIKILVDKSVFGISYPSIVLESATNWITIIYNWYRGNPLSIYGENVFILVQNLVIMLLFVFFIRNMPKGVEDPGQNAFKKYIAYLISVLLTIFLTMNPFSWPQIVIESSMVLQMMLISMARLAQIIHIYQSKSTGSLAFITCFLVVLGNLARLFTIIVEVGNDYLYALSAVIAFFLNLLIMIQFFVYWKSDQKIKQQ